MRSPDMGHRSSTAILRALAGGMVAMVRVALVLSIVLGWPSGVLAASPAPSQPGVGDPRSSGQGPGLVGDPLTAIVIVAAIALLSVAATLAYVRATARRD